MAEPTGPGHAGFGAAEPPARAAESLSHSIVIRARLDESESSAVLRLVAAAAQADGVAPLSEHVMLHLRYGGDPRARNLLLYHGAELAGYAHLDPTDPVEGPSGELVIHPAFRRRGYGRMLAGAVLAETEGRPLRLWAHGDLPGAGRLATEAGLTRIRSLWQLERSLQTPLDEPVFADGITVRTFEPGRDEQMWTDLNRRAFERHPEQGAWTREDLEKREQEAWFDPSGFFLAERAGRLVGFHWTKVHGGRAENGGQAAAPGTAAPGTAAPGTATPGTATHGHEAIGEVYVVGVDPAERGSGLGRALTLAGLRYLRSRGLHQVMLYVDESNTPAIRLYESLGFTHRGTDVMFRHPGLSRRAGGPGRMQPPRQAPPRES